MKKVLLIALVALLTTSCTPDPNVNRSIQQKTSGGYMYEFEPVIIEGCEYLIITNAYNNNICVVHKGNCHNPEHNPLPMRAGKDY